MTIEVSLLLAVLCVVIPCGIMAWNTQSAIITIQKHLLGLGELSTSNQEVIAALARLTTAHNDILLTVANKPADEVEHD
ncbi:MAG: hypothetical protein V3W52_17235 [Syntrophobacteria bacterium]